MAFMAREMSLPLIDMVMEQDEKHQGPLLAQIIRSLGNEYLERRGLLQSRTDVTTRLDSRARAAQRCRQNGSHPSPN